MNRKDSTFSEWLIDWRGYLALLVMSISGSSLRLYVHSQQKYSDFVAGKITWQSLNKSIDNHLLILFFILFTTGLLSFNFLLVRLKKRFPLTDTSNDLQLLLLLATCPAIWLAGNSFFLKPPIPTSLFIGASVLIALVVFFAAAVLFWVNRPAEPVPVIEIIGASVAVLVGSVFGAMAILAALVRGLLIHSVCNLQTELLLIGSSICLSLIALAIVWLRAKSAEQLRYRIFGLTLAAQLFLPGLYFLFIPSPWLVDGVLQHGYAASKWLWLLVAVLMLCTYVNIGIKLTRWSTRKHPMALNDVFSPLALMATILLFKMPLVDIVNIPADDYHFGENLLPGFLWLQHNLVWFVDYDPARGVFQTFSGILAVIFFDGTAAAINHTGGLISALFSIALIVSLAPIVGSLFAALIVLLYPFYHSSQLVVISFGALILLQPPLIKKRLVWLTVWLVSTIILSLFSPQYGPAYGLGTASIVLYMLVQEYHQNWKRLTVFSSILAVLTTFVLLLTPLGEISVGMLRYTLENLSVNVTANGIPWLSGWNNTKHPLGVIFWEVSRASWLVVLLLILILFIRETTTPGRGKNESRLIALAIFGGILLLLIPYGFGRIDPDYFTRIGYISVYCVSIVLPFILFVTAPKSDKTYVILVSVVGASIMSGGLSPWLASWRDTLYKPVHVAVPDSKRLIEGKEIGFPMLGKAYINQEHFERLSKVKRSLDILLKEGETYLDLTNRQAHYFYMNKPVPIQSGAAYNLPGTAMQLRALKRLANKNVPAVLISADNLLQDGGPVSLRSYLLYREFMLHYVPIVMNDLVFLVDSRRIPYVNALLEQNNATATVASLELLNSIFVKDNLELLPVAWGQSFDTLSDKLTKYIALDAAPHQLNNVRLEKDNWLIPEREDPSITIDTSTDAISGKSAGMLSFDFECQGANDAPVTLEVYWKPAQQDTINETAVVRFQAKNGKLLVPMDISPKWLLADKIDALRIDLREYSACSKFRIQNLKVSQRVSAIEADALWPETK